ncbi:hypothetical protein LTR85_004877 [Meristemomyces frigidus]|nr:hypothetical protein LTR85_004877 [Meristemomyces frigidus]
MTTIGKPFEIGLNKYYLEFMLSDPTYDDLAREKCRLNIFNVEIVQSNPLFDFGVTHSYKWSFISDSKTNWSYNVEVMPSAPTDQCDVMIGSGVEKRGLVKKVGESKTLRNALGKGFIQAGVELDQRQLRGQVHRPRAHPSDQPYVEVKISFHNNTERWSSIFDGNKLAWSLTNINREVKNHRNKPGDNRNKVRVHIHQTNRSFIFDGNKLAWSLTNINREVKNTVELDVENGRYKTKIRVHIRQTNRIRLDVSIACMDSQSSRENFTTRWTLIFDGNSMDADMEIADKDKARVHIR